MILPCGLNQEEIIDLMYRDIDPEDFEALSKLDEGLPKRSIAGQSLIEKLPQMTAMECGVTSCGVCLAEVAANSLVVKLPCGHGFHPPCISKWLTQCKNSCPFCAAPLKQTVTI
jgi:E3 ubiquitin-protein ligase ZSWIM2